MSIDDEKEHVLGADNFKKIEMPVDKPFRVAGTANVHDLAWAISKGLEEGHRPVLIAIGVQAITQAVKAIAVANSRVASQGKIFTVLPAFENVMIPNQQTKVNEERTVMKLILVGYRF